MQINAPKMKYEVNLNIIMILGLGAVTVGWGTAGG